MTQPVRLPPWWSDHEPQPADIARALCDVLPDGRPWRVEALGTGWDFFTFRAVDATHGDAWVARVPRRPETVPWLARETAVLASIADALAGATDVMVPRYEVRDAQHPAVAHPFGVYPLLPGVPALDAGLDRAAVARLGNDLGRFLAALHRVPLSVLPAGEHQLPPDNRPDRWREQIRIVADVLGTGLAASCDSWLTEHACGATGERVVSHADLGAEHVLVDRVSGRLCSVIDWGDVRAGVAGGDLAGPWVALGDAVLESALDVYAPPDRESVARLARFRGVRCLLDEVRWYTYRGNRAAAVRFVERLRGVVTSAGSGRPAAQAD